MTNYVAIFADPGSGGSPMFGEIDIRDVNGRRMDTTNSTVVHGYASDWDEATDEDTSTYYYGTDENNTEVTIVHFDDGAKATTAKFFRGSGSFDTYAPVGIRVYQDTTNHGANEADWPIEKRLVDETYSASVGWTDQYIVDGSVPAETFNVNRDTFIDGSSSDREDNNYGDGTSVQVDLPNKYAFFDAPKPELEGGVIAGITLEMVSNYSRPSPYTLHVYEVQGEWDEMSLTYETQPPIEKFAEVTIPEHGSSNEWLSIYIPTDGVDLSNGIAFATNGANTYYTHESYSNRRPRFTYHILVPPDAGGTPAPMTADAGTPDAVVSIEYPFDYSAQPMTASAETVDAFVEAEAEVSGDVVTATAEMGDSSAGLTAITRPDVATAEGTVVDPEVSGLWGIVKDTYVSAQYNDTNYSDRDRLRIGPGSDAAASPYIAYLDFDYPETPEGKVLSGVTVKLTYTGYGTLSSSWYGRVNKVTGEWDATTLTYDNRPDYEYIRLFNLVGYSEGDVLEIDLTGYELPHGIAISTNEGNARTFYSSAGPDPLVRPHVVFEYEDQLSPVANADPFEASAETVDAAFALGDEMKPAPVLASVEMTEAAVSTEAHLEAPVLTAEASEIGGGHGWSLFINAEPMDASTEAVDPSLDLEVGVDNKFGTLSASNWLIEPMVNGMIIEENPASDPYYQRVTRLQPKYFFRMRTETDIDGSVIVDEPTGMHTLHLRNTERRADGPENRVYRRLSGDSMLGQSGFEGDQPFGDDEITGQGPQGGTTKPAGTLEFSLRTTKQNQFVFYQQDRSRTYASTRRNTPNELWIEDGRLVLYSFPFDSSEPFTRGVMETYTDIADGDWHHITISHATGHYRETVVRIDGKLERRVYYNNNVELNGFPDFWGNKPSVINYGRSVGDNDGFVGDLAELVWYGPTHKSIHDLNKNYYAFMGWKPVEGEPFAATAETVDASAKGNKPRVLYLVFNDQAPTGRGDNMENGIYWSTIMPRNVNGEEFEGAKWGITGRGVDMYDATFFPVGAYSGSYGTDGPGMAWTDKVTGEQRMLDLDEDLDMDDFDVIAFQDWPTDIDYIRWLDDTFPGNRERLINQLKEQARNGKRLMVTHHRLAVDLGIIDRVEYVPRNGGGFGDYASAMKFPWNIDTNSNITKTDYPRSHDGEPANRDPAYLRHKAQFYGDTHFNARFRVKAIIEGLTDVPSYMIKEAVFHREDTEWPWAFSAYQYLKRMDGLQIGDEFFFQDHNAPGNWWFSGSRGLQEESYGRLRGTWGVPPGHVRAGTVVTTYGSKIWKGENEIDNPVKDWATTIAVQEGDTLDGEPIQGRIFVSFTEAPIDMFEELGAQHITQEALDEFGSRRRSDQPTETEEQLTWDASGTRVSTSSTVGTIGTPEEYITVGGEVFRVYRYYGALSGARYRDTNDDTLTMIRSRSLYPVYATPYITMTGRGFLWVTEGLAEAEDPGRNNVRVEPMEASVETPEPETTSEFGADVTATAVNAWASMPKVEEDESGYVDVLSMPMTASTSFSGYSSEYKAGVMTASGELRDNIEVDQETEEQVVLTLHGFDVTLYLKEEV